MMGSVPASVRLTAFAFGSAALAVLAGMWGAVADAPTPPAFPPRLASAGNGRVAEVPTDPSGAWTLQLLSDIQDGFLYVPQLLHEGEEHGARAVVIAGDLAIGAGEEHFSLLLRELRSYRTSVPLFAVPGNHDEDSDGDARRFDSAFGGREFEFRIGSTWVVGFDSMDPQSRKAAKPRLRSRIQRASLAGERVVVVCHHSPLNVNKDGSDGDPRRTDRALIQILSDPSVAFVFSGHVHRERSDDVAGVRFVIAPPSGDKSAEQGQTEVSYLLLRWTGERFLLERHQLPRRNALELEGALSDDLVAHVVPWIRGILRGSARVRSNAGAFGRS